MSVHPSPAPAPLPFYRTALRLPFLHPHSNRQQHAPAYRGRLRSLISQIDASCVRGHVLDLADGEGLLLPALDQRFRNVTCLHTDVSGATRVANVMQLRRVELRQGALSSLNGDRYDAIVALHPSFGDDPSASVRFLASHLRPGGWLFAVLPAHSTFVSRASAALTRSLPATSTSGDSIHVSLSAHGFTVIEQQILRCISMLPRWSVQTLRLSPQG